MNKKLLLAIIVIAAAFGIWKVTSKPEAAPETAATTEPAPAATEAAPAATEAAPAATEPAPATTEAATTEAPASPEAALAAALDPAKFDAAAVTAAIDASALDDATKMALKASIAAAGGDVVKLGEVVVAVKAALKLQ